MVLNKTEKKSVSSTWISSTLAEIILSFKIQIIEKKYTALGKEFFFGIACFSGLIYL